MSKVFENVTADLLEQKIRQIAYSAQDLIRYLGDDLTVDFGSDFFENRGRVIEDLLGYRTLENGFTFLGYCANGDAEEPVFFIVYWDGYRIRGYVPESGNVYNTDTMTAFGRDDATDILNLQKRFPDDKIEDIPKIVMQFNWDAIEYELSRDFTLRQFDKSYSTMSLRERVESLKYFYPQDEEGKLFLDSCKYCRSLFDLGHHEKAEVVYLWAKEMCKESKQFALENYRNLSEFIQGEWYEYVHIG